MRKLTLNLNLTFLLLLIGSIIYAQCVVMPSCDNTVSFSGTITNQTYNSSTCFISSNGQIPSSNNWNNWEYLSFSGDINVVQDINCNGSSNKVYTTGNIVIHKLSLSGGDTLFNDGTLEIKNMVSNNSFGTTWNYIMTTSDIVFHNNTYSIGDTIITAGGTSNNVVVLGCPGGTPLPIVLQYFTLKNNVLSWFIIGEKCILQYKSNGKWVNIYNSNLQKDSYNATLKGEYRLCVENDGKPYYSQIIYVRGLQTTNKDYILYDIIGRRVTNDTKGILIKRYSDGTAEKIYNN